MQEGPSNEKCALVAYEKKSLLFNAGLFWPIDSLG